MALRILTQILRLKLQRHQRHRHQQTHHQFELVNDSKYRNIQNQIGLRNDWPKVHNIRPINFVNKDAAFYNFKSADGNGRKQIVKETLAACKGLEELLKC